MLDHVNDQLIYDMPNYKAQPTTARVAYSHGCHDEFGYVQHNTATWSEIRLLRNDVWIDWDVNRWGYGTYYKNVKAYGIYTAHPVSAYLAKPNGPDPAGDSTGV